jgi:oligoribonuclease NrnB/cAMP/cGMP phosphodiesterase (DHH superfamily)
MLLSQEKRQRDADADELGQGEIDEYDTALKDVNAEIGVDHDQEQARQKRVNKKIERFHDFSNAQYKLHRFDYRTGKLFSSVLLQ